MSLRCIGAALLFALAASAAEQGRPPWSLTIAERLALRLDPERLADRARRYASNAGPGSATPRFVIEGQREPELFLPYEVMGQLLNTQLEDEAAQQRIRSTYAAAIRDFGWSPTEFWQDVESIGGEYARLAKSFPPERTDQTERRICSSRADALAHMREKYRRFDEFLYREVAPRHTVYGDTVPTAAWSAWLEGGCR